MKTKICTNCGQEIGYVSNVTLIYTMRRNYNAVYR